MGDFSDAEQNGFGTGTSIIPLLLVVVYGLVGIFAICVDEILNMLEFLARDTSYQAMMQRIYREVMIMGLGSFLLGIMETANVSLGYEWDLAYYFADQCAFVTSVFFAFHGLGLMAISVYDARAWERAGKIESRRLLVDVENYKKKHPIIWMYRYFPFCSTRSQVEFRIFRALFSSTYYVGGDSRTFDFALFLRKYHESNLLTLINLDAWKWFIVLVMIGSASLFERYYHPRCHDGNCKDRCSLIAFTVGGSALVVCAVALLFVGRLSEFKLLRKVGVLDAIDLEVFLLKEHRVRELISCRELDRNIIITTIAELKHESAVKSFQKQEGLMTFNYTGGGSEANVKSRLSTASMEPGEQVGQLSLIGSLKQQLSSRFAAPKNDSQQESDDHQLPDKQKKYTAVSLNGPLSKDGDDNSTYGDFVSTMSLKIEAVGSAPPGTEKTSCTKIVPEECQEISVVDYTGPVSGSNPVDTGVSDVTTASPTNGTPITRELSDLLPFSSEELPNELDQVEKNISVAENGGTDGGVIMKRPFSFRALVSRGSDTSLTASESKFSETQPMKRVLWPSTRSFKVKKEVCTDAISSVEGGNELSPRGKLPMAPGQAKTRLSSAKSVFDMVEASPRSRGSGSFGRSFSRGLSFMSEMSPSKVRESTMRSYLKPLPSLELTADLSEGRKSARESHKVKLNKQQRIAKRKLKEKLGVGYNDGAEHATYFKDIFVWRCPRFYYSAIDVIMTANSLYFSWWITTFIFVARRLDNSREGLMWVFVSILPALITFPLLGVVIRTATVLKSLTELDLDTVALVVEKTIEIRKHLSLLREHLRKRIDRLPPAERDAAVTELFSAVDDTENGELTREDFRRMLVRLQMFLDKSIWNAIFSAIDINDDNIITFEHVLSETAASIAAENDEAIKKRGQEEAAERILDMINPANSHPNHLSAEDFFG